MSTFGKQPNVSAAPNFLTLLYDCARILYVEVVKSFYDLKKKIASAA